MDYKAMGNDTTLWMGAIQPNWDESFLYRLFSTTGEVQRVKVMRNQHTGLPAGYAFIHFRSHDAARRVLELYNGRNIPGTNLVFRLNWGTRNKSSPSQNQPQFPQQIQQGYQQNQNQQNQHSLFVGDLASEVTDQILLQTFKMRYGSCADAKVIMDPATGQSKGYGFVRFADKQESLKAMQEMQGAFIGTRQIRIGEATQKRADQQQQHPHQQAYHQAGMYHYGMPQMMPEHNTSTVFIGNLDASVDQAAIQAHFGGCGVIENIKIPPNRGCGFVKFSTRAEADKAIKTLHGSMLGTTRIRLDWGKYNAGRGGSNSNDASNHHHMHLQGPAGSAGIVPPPNLAMSPVAGSVGMPMMYPAGWPQMPYYPQAGAPAFYGQYYAVPHSPQHGGARGFVDPSAVAAGTMAYPQPPFVQLQQQQFTPSSAPDEKNVVTSQSGGSKESISSQPSSTPPSAAVTTVSQNATGPLVEKENSAPNQTMTSSKKASEDKESEPRNPAQEDDYRKPFDVKAANKAYVDSKQDLDPSAFQSRVANNMTMIS